MGDTQAFSITDSVGSGGGWLKIGQSFRAYELSEYDSETETLTLVRDGREFEISLAGSKASPADPGSMDERMKEAGRLMELMNFEKMIDDSLEAQMNAMSDILRRQLAQASPDGKTDEEPIEFQAKAMRSMFSEIDWAPIEAGLTEAYAEVFSQEELAGMANFYTTPAGQASIEKMPEIQRKSMEVMMPAIMQASNKMQQEMTAFMKERTKRLQELNEEGEKLIEAAE